MKPLPISLGMVVVSLFFATALLAQSPSSANQSAASPASAAEVPRLIKFSGTLLDAQDRPMAGPVGVTFALHAQQTGGAALWLETQNVTPDAHGNYTVLLGANTAAGLPEELFRTGEARWLGIQPEREPELPRVLLVSAPYALKAADAETLGGLPPSAFMLASSPSNISVSAIASAPTVASTSGIPAPAAVTNVTTTGGVANYLPIFNGASTIIDSAVYQSGTGATAKVGINTTSPAATLDVNGSVNVKGPLTLPATGVATAIAGASSQPENFVASSYSSGTGTAVNQTFKWQAEAASNDTATPSGTLNLLFGSGTTAPAETGLHLNNKGIFIFATGQTFPSTITGVTAGTDLTGGGTTGNVTLNLDTTKVPRLVAANTFVGNQSVTGNVTASSEVQGGVVNATTSFDIAGTPFAFGSYANHNSFLGFAGNSTMTGGHNTASGVFALSANTTGSYNTASGVYALYSNTTGINNTASGARALFSNTAGSDNTSSGYLALYSNTTGAANTASGAQALISNTTGYNNTASGVSALSGNTTGSNNTASGVSALSGNTTGGYNTASGGGALFNNHMGSYNTASGFNALLVNKMGTLLTCIGYSCDVAADGLSNATAIGANAMVGESNALVLGSISGVNGAAASVNVGIGTTAPLYTLDVHGTGNFTGPVNFAAGQTFPGTITSVNPGTGLTSSVTGSNVTLNVDTTKIPQLSAANTFTASQSVIGSVTATNVSATGITGGVVNATNVNAIGAVNSGVINATTSFDIGGTPFAFGSYANGNSFLGFAGNSTMTGVENTAIGIAALQSNTEGYSNTASGHLALNSNTTGAENTAIGVVALQNNTTGNANIAIGSGALNANTTGNTNTAIGQSALDANSTGSNNTASGFAALNSNTTGGNNTASGQQALVLNSTGSNNTASGDSALWSNTTGSNNTASGRNALFSSKTGTLLTCIGYSCDVAADGLSNATAIGGNAMVGESNALVLGSISGVNGATSSTNVGIGTATPQYTLDVNGNANFSGNVSIGGSISKGSGSFKIDHPLDPANKYLYHSFVESPDMMNVYNGNIKTDDVGLATVTLPDWFGVLNRDFRYQLTVIGQFAQAIVASEISHNQFTIRTDKPNVKVSWQVTGIRQDAYANAHRIQVEENKPQQEQGHYLHPELFGAPPEQAVGYQAPATPTHAETARASTSTAPSAPLK